MRKGGTAVFFCGSALVFGAFAFAPASVVAPLESLQFVVNLAFQRLVNSLRITPMSAAGTALILLGTVMAVVAGPKDRTLVVPLRQLEGYWTSPGWVVYFCGVLALAASAEAVRRHHNSSRNTSEGGSSSTHMRVLLPLTFAMTSALIGAQMQVQSKSVAEAIKVLVAGDSAVWASYFL